MMFNIILKESNEVNKDAKKEIDKILFENSIKKIIIGFDMVEHLSDIMNIIGDDYERILCAVPYCEAGLIKFISSNDQLFEVKFFENISRLDTSDLDKALVIDKASYLIMNQNTLVMLSNAKPDNIDKYLNGKAYYHSYNKIPIAICEFLETGKIELIKTVVVPV